MRSTDIIDLVIVEDDYLVREGARAVLDVHPRTRVLATFADADEMRQGLDGLDPHAVLLDVRMPPTFTTEGIELARELRSSRPDLGVIMLSQYDDPEYALELLEEGSERLGYLLKERLGDADRLVQSIEEVHAGGSVLDPSIVTGILQVQNRRSRSRLAGLTPRELEVLELMASGRGNAAIAADLAISERSVEKHNNAIFRKLGFSEEVDLNRRVAAVLFYLHRTRD